MDGLKENKKRKYRFKPLIMSSIKLYEKRIYTLHKKVCELNDVEFFHSFSKSRKREIVFTRQLTMKIVYDFTSLSYSEVGSIFNKEHATALHARKTINNLSDTDKSVKTKLEQLETLARVLFKRKYKNTRFISTKDRLIEALKCREQVNFRINIREIISEL